MKALVCALLLSAAAGAQPARDWTVLGALTPGAEIRVELAGGKTVRGYFQNATPDAIVVNAATSQEMLARVDVRRVQLKRPSHRGRNTLIGLAAGAGGGMAAGAAFDAKADFLYEHAGKIVLTAIGAIAGTVVGVAWPTGRWRDVYRL
jgi:hypothetical protein